jgi:hypothetical protein
MANFPAVTAPLRATVSGSFRQFMPAVHAAVQELSQARVVVLSPADPRVVDSFGDFLFVASDRLRTIRLVQNRHLAAIAHSDLVWLVAENGYVGQSAAMEIGYAAARGVPVFCATPPSDLTIRQYVSVVPSVEVALMRLAESDGPGSLDVLLDPDDGLDLAHDHLEIIRRELTTPRAHDDGGAAVASARAVRSALNSIG